MGMGENKRASRENAMNASSEIFHPAIKCVTSKCFDSLAVLCNSFNQKSTEMQILSTY